MIDDKFFNVLFNSSFLIYHLSLLLSKNGYFIFKCISCLSRIDIKENQNISFFIFFCSFDNSLDITQFLHSSIFWFDAKFVENKLRDLLQFISIIHSSVSLFWFDGNGFSLSHTHSYDTIIQPLDDLS